MFYKTTIKTFFLRNFSIYNCLANVISGNFKLEKWWMRWENNTVELQ